MKTVKHTRLKRASQALGATAVSLLLASSLAACSGTSAASPSCDEFAKMGPTTGLLSEFTAEQEKAVGDALEAGGYETGATNYALARTSIIAYCNIYDGVASGNKDSPISNALK